ncbi:uncharacterized protein FFB20_00145 [Fusarium fujikuroi]|nr:uncharacterized protein FFB20_00145 [Fusarium fujikuroi]SCN87082.1 uncharacterized protein FFE2_06220 [Fusarium fujikuroi]SCO31256.1 uncharacterized protein FFNC_01948 [Fusarium fujikuroi]SCV42398.1 uncharacterized protein FFFS_06572 [Fusarium fujikuroi]
MSIQIKRSQRQGTQAQGRNPWKLPRIKRSASKRLPANVGPGTVVRLMQQGFNPELRVIVAAGGWLRVWQHADNWRYTSLVASCVLVGKRGCNRCIRPRTVMLQDANSC